MSFPRLTVLVVHTQFEQTPFVAPHRQIVVHHTKGIVAAESHCYLVIPRTGLLVLAVSLCCDVMRSPT